MSDVRQLTPDQRRHLEQKVQREASRSCVSARNLPKPDLSKLEDWKKHHAAHGRGPYKDVTIGSFEHWVCRGCGEKKITSN